MKNITKEQTEFKLFEQAIYKILCRVGCKLIEEYLRIRDQQVMAERDVEEYRAVNNGTTTIKTVMGEASYTRRRYKKRTGGYIYLLDEIIGIGGNYGLISENLAEQILTECAEKSYRKAADSINNLTGQSISAMGAWGVMKRFGERLNEQEERLRELERGGETGQLGNLACCVLFSELDDVWISMQKEKRRKEGAWGEKGTEKAGKQAMHIGTAYTGWSRKKDGCYRTENKIAYASFGGAPGFAADFETILSHRYDMDGVQRRIASGDGASWIRTAAENSEAVLQLDPYHRSQAIIKAIGDRNDRRKVFAAIRERDVRNVLHIIAGMITAAKDEEAREKLVKLFDYFSKNRKNLLTWQERGIELPSPPEGIEYRNLGVQESSNCNIITQRMKHRKGSWSISGGNHMAKMLCLRNTIGLDAMLGWLPEATEVNVAAEPLSAAKVPVYDGKGDGGQWFHADMPFEQTFRTFGREAIRGMLKQRPLSGLAYL